MANEWVLIQCDRARKYVGPSWEFHEGYRLIEEGEPRELHLTSVKLFLLAQALELALKGWLVLKQGVTPQTLQRRHRHNLDNLAEAVEPYYPEIAGWRPSIAHITASYAGRDYQYPEGGRATQAAIFPLADFAQMVEGCRARLDTAISQDRHFASLQGRAEETS